jgi:hypothetical protein
MDIIGRLWADSPLCLTREQFERSLEGWEIDPVYGADGLAVGVFLVKGPELHFSKFDKTAVTREHLRKLTDLIKTHGYATTRTPKDDERMLRLNKRLGFYHVGEDEFDIHLRIDKFRVKDSPCL